MPPGFRAADELKNDVQDLWISSVAPATHSIYQTGFQCLIHFLIMSGCIIPPDSLPTLTEDVLIYFVTYCHKSLELQWATIKVYLAGVRFHYLKAGLENPLASGDRLQCILRGIKRSQKTNSNAQLRLPITFSILSQICELLSAGVFTPRIDITLQCMCSLAYCGFLRCGEFTVKSNNACTYLKCKDVIFATDQSMFNLKLHTSKTDPFRLGVDIPFYRNKSNTWCPVLLMDKYLRQGRHVYGLSNFHMNDPLFVDEEGKPFNRTRFLCYLKQILCRLGYDENKYNGHSFRIGAASSAAAAGMEDHMIQTLGRWSSSCYTRYIRVERSAIQTAQARMCHKLH